MSSACREVKDTRFLPEKLTSKVAKEVYDTFSEYETKHKRYFSGRPTLCVVFL